MNATMQLLLSISLQAGVLAAVVWILTRLFKNAPAALRHALWVIVLVKFFIPPFAYLPNELAFWQNSPKTQPAAVHSMQEPVSNAGPSSGVHTLSAETPMPTESASPQSASYSIPNTGNIVIMLWLAGVLVMGSILLVGCRYQRRFAIGTQPDDGLLDLLKRCADQLRVRRLPRLILSQSAPVPMLMGVLRPVIILPKKIVESCSESDLSAMILHELAHIKRRDIVTAWLYQAARILFFFHPAVWLAGHEIQKEQELACDELVLLSSTLSSEEYARGYMSALQFANEGRLSPIAAMMAEPFDVEKNRLTLMLRQRIPKLTALWISVACLVAILGVTTFAGIEPNLSKMISINGKAGIIAFIRDGDVYTIETDGSNLYRLTTDGRNAFPIWSPDGRYIAFSKAGKVRVSESYESPVVSLWITTPDGKSMRPIMEAKKFEAYYPSAWLPEMSGLLVTFHILESDAHSELRVVTLDGKAYPRIGGWKNTIDSEVKPKNMNSFAYGTSVAFSPDWDRMIFTQIIMGDPDMPYQMDIDRLFFGGGISFRRLQRLTHIYIKNLRWSPCDIEILSAEERYQSKAGTRDAGLWLRGTDGKIIRKLTDLTMASISGDDWSPDGKWIVFQTPDKDYSGFANTFEHPDHFAEMSKHSSIWIINKDGTNRYRFLTNACHPNWR